MKKICFKERNFKVYNQSTDCTSKSRKLNDVFVPLGRGTSQPCKPGRPTVTHFDHPKSTPRPRNQLTFHFSAGHPRCLSVTADAGEGGEMNRSSKGSMDPRRQTLHHALGPPSLHGREMPTPSPDSAIATSLQTNEDERHSCSMRGGGQRV